MRPADQHPKAFWRPRGGFAVAVFVATLGFAASSGAAAAQTAPPPPDDDSSIDQYVEEIPTGSGGVAPGTGAKETQPLAPSVSAQLDQAGGDAALQELATSSEAGAPQDDLAPVERRPGVREPGVGDGSALSAAVSAVSGTGAGRLLGLLAALLLLTAGVISAAAYRHARRRA